MHPKLDELIRYRNDYFPDISKSGIRAQNAESDRRDRESLKASNAFHRQQKRNRKSKSTSTSKQLFYPRKNKTTRLYVKGIYVKDIQALFSYNLQNVSINRDRSTVDDFDMFTGIRDAFQSSDFNQKMANKYWEMCQNSNTQTYFEYQKPYDFNDNADKMVKGFYKIFGKKAVVATDNFMQTEAQALGYNPIVLNGVQADVAISLGIKTDSDVSGFFDGVKLVKPTKYEQKLLNHLDRIKNALNLPDAKVKIASKIIGDDKVWGLADRGNNTVTILRSLFLPTRKTDLLRTLIHEFKHIESNAGDGTREFTSSFELEIIKLLTTDVSEIQRIVAEFLK